MELGSPHLGSQSLTLVAYMGRLKAEIVSGFSYIYAEMRASEELPATTASSGAFLFLFSFCFRVLRRVTECRLWVCMWQGKAEGGSMELGSPHLGSQSLTLAFLFLFFIIFFSSKKGHLL